ncbi:unnamed protein product [Ceutorhynchus assimilis]|uniref:Uncharacterized protein n=1 Tax=Ceutorhynchus assimilis TaxID=467358 RepID=A0A9N9QH79_9CUCU|nr:unnamed protein product [Ceutorhynchus assimilis]
MNGEEVPTGSEDVDYFFLGSITEKPSLPWRTSVLINGVSTEFKVETGADVTVTSSSSCREKKKNAPVNTNIVVDLPADIFHSNPCPSQNFPSSEKETEENNGEGSAEYEETEEGNEEGSEEGSEEDNEDNAENKALRPQQSITLRGRPRDKTSNACMTRSRETTARFGRVSRPPRCGCGDDPVGCQHTKLFALEVSEIQQR